MILSNTDFNVLYVDPSAATAGDGSTPANALKTLPASASALADGTCYIIRRTLSGEAVLPHGENSSVTALAVVGMPKSGDALYGFMPQEAKTAWGGDAADYANVRAATRNDPWGDDTQGLSLPGCLTFFLHRVNLYREGQEAYEAAIQLSDEASKSSVSVERCRFGLKGCQLESDSCTSAPSYGAGMYLKVGKAQVLSLRHCLFNVIPPQSSYGPESYSAAWAVYAAGARFLTVADIDVWCATSQNSGDMGYGGSEPVFRLGYYNSYDYSHSGNCTDASCENIRLHYVQNGSGGTLPPLLGLVGGDFACVRSISLAMESRVLGSGSPSVVSPGGILIDCGHSVEYIYEDISVNLPKVWRIPNGCGIVKLAGASGNVPGYTRKIGNISISLGTAGGVDTDRNGNYYTELGREDTQYWRSYAALQIDGAAYYDGPESGGCHKPLIVRNVDVVHPRGVALYAANCHVKGCSLQGMLRASAAVCDIESLASWYPGYAVGTSYGCTVRIGTMTLGRGNIAGTESHPAIVGNPVESGCYIYVGSSNVQLLSDTRGTSTSCDNGFAVACGSEQDEGHYTMRTPNAMCNTWGVARSGGTVPASLKLSNNTADGPGFLSLGRLPFSGFRIEAEAGRRKLVVYAAAKGLAELSELAQRVLVQVSVPQGGGCSETLFSSTSGRWSPDDSTWIGESGLSPFRLEMPLDIPTSCEVDVKILLRWYSASGYLYVDPGMSIIQEE